MAAIGLEDLRTSCGPCNADDMLNLRTEGGARLDVNGFRLQTEGRLAAALRGKRGPVVAGLRPEHLRPVSLAIDHSREALRGRIELIEPLGSQVMIQMTVGDTLVTARFERGPELEVGRAITLDDDRASLQVFDADDAGRSVLAA